jgi:hypothetical protein
VAEDGGLGEEGSEVAIIDAPLVEDGFHPGSVNKPSSRFYPLSPRILSNAPRKPFP